ncbi:lipopolysaccharide biosynthesis protein [Nesterenkonia aurantiaca]|uniref:lipopolysaccharide biosynthesis protein n=1 Tax=Nesterenkonia aurantiaca TaxID=1436010 RepID=UPI003EE6874D
MTQEVSTRASSYDRLAKRVRSESTALHLFAAQVVIAIGALVVNVLAARGLGPEARGELALFLQIAYAGNLLCMLGRHRAYTRYRVAEHSLARSFKELRRLAWLPQGLALVLATILGLGFGEYGWGLLFFILAFFFKLSSGILVNTHRAGAIVAAQAAPFSLASGVSQVALVAGALFLSLEEVSSVELWLMLYGVTAAVPYMVVELLVRFKARGEELTPQEIRPITRLGYRLVPMGVAEALLSRADRFLIPVLSTYSQLGFYAVVVTMTELVSWPVKQYAETRVPVWDQTFRSGKLHVWKELARVGGLTAIACSIVATGVYFTLIPLFGPEYDEGLRLILPLTLSAALYSLTIYGMNLGVATGHARIANIATFGGFAAALPAYLLLIGPFGAMGAAWGSVIGYGVSTLITIGYLGKVKRWQYDDTRT